MSQTQVLLKQEVASKKTSEKVHHSKTEETSQKYVEIDDVSGILSKWNLFLIYLAFATILFVGYIREFSNRVKFFLGIKKNPLAPPPGYASLYKDIEYFWLNWVYKRIRDNFERPIASVPGCYFEIMERYSKDENYTFNFTGRKIKCLNLGSYNYLGFAQNEGPVIDTVEDSINKFGIATASPRNEAGTCDVVEELEKTIARFIGKPAALVIGMGFATNSTTIPIICGSKGTLIISDSLNHNSIVTGSRDADGAKIRVFKHNNPEDLEKVLRDSIVEGQPRTRRPWKKIIIIVEGIYSMEGEIVKLREIVALKKKYKAYLYLDEAHSIGALGKTGRGACEYWGVDPSDVDVLMGTFTKAFGSVGGYISGSEEFIAYLKNKSYGTVYSTAMAPPCAQQALSALKIIMGEDGTTDGQRRISKLSENSNYFRKRLIEEGFHVYGDRDSPVILMMLYQPAAMGVLSRLLLKKGIAIVVVGFPVTPLLLNRVRFCISSSHSIEALEEAVKIIADYGDKLGLKYAKYANYKRPDIELSF